MKLIESILLELSKEVFFINDDGLPRFCGVSINILNRHAPRKRKLARGNQISNAIYNKRSLKSNNEKIKTTQ